MERADAPVKLTKRQELFKLAQFVLFSISAGVIQIILYTVLSEAARLSHWLAYLPALIASVLWNFTFNRRFTFKSVSDIRAAMLKITIYYLIFTPASTWWVSALSNLETGVNASLFGYIILIGTMLINFLTEFCVYRFWIYRGSINTSAAGKREQAKTAPRGAPDL